jgi:flagellar basal-body rod protein FlgB
MFIEHLLNQGNAPLLEQTLKFTAARQRLIGENIVNATTPGYRTKDLSLEKFQKLLRERADKRATSGPGSVRFGDIVGEVENPNNNILFHDGNNRSMEQLQADMAKNGMLHNLVIELLRKQFSALESALKERIG